MFLRIEKFVTKYKYLYIDKLKAINNIIKFFFLFIFCI